MPEWFFDWPLWLQIASAIGTACVALWGLIQAIEGLYESYRKYGPGIEKRLRAFGAERTIVSTLIAFLVAGSLGAVGWRAFLRTQSSSRPAASEKFVRLEWRPDAQGLKVAIASESTETLRDVWLEVLDIRKRSPTGDFMEVAALHGTGSFEKYTISAGFGSDVYPDKPLVLDFVRRGDTNGLGPSNPEAVGLWRAMTRRSNEVLEWVAIPSPGVWRVTFGGTNGIQVRHPHLYFEWTLGAAPKPWTP